jgi:hypothetical protein
VIYILGVLVIKLYIRCQSASFDTAGLALLSQASFDTGRGLTKLNRATLKIESYFFIITMWVFVFSGAALIYLINKMYCEAYYYDCGNYSAVITCTSIAVIINIGFYLLHTVCQAILADEFVYRPVITESDDEPAENVVFIIPPDKKIQSTLMTDEELMSQYADSSASDSSDSTDSDTTYEEYDFV